MTDRPLDLTISFLQSKPGRAARVLDELDPADVAAFLETVPKRIAGPAVGSMLRWRGAACLELLSADQAAGLMESMNYYDAIGLLREIGDATRRVLLGELPRDLARKLSASLRYPEGTVGTLLDPSAPMFAQDASVDETLHFIRQQPRPDVAHVFLRDAKGRFAGAVPIATLMRSRPTMKLAGFADRTELPVSSRAALASVAQDPAWDGYPVRPVVGARHFLLGSLSRRVLRHALTQHDAAPLHLQATGLVANAVTMYLDSVQELLRFVAQPTNSRGRDR